MPKPKRGSIKTQPDFPSRTSDGGTMSGQESASTGSRNVGRYEQGGIAPRAPMGDEFLNGDKMPTKAAPAGPVPKNQVPVRDNGNTVGNNDAHKV